MPQASAEVWRGVVKSLVLLCFYQKYSVFKLWQNWVQCGVVNSGSAQNRFCLRVNIVWEMNRLKSIQLYYIPLFEALEKGRMLSGGVLLS